MAKAAATLIRQWLQGVLAVTAAGLAAMIAALLAKRLAPVLRSLWRDAWALGRDMGAEVLGVPAPSASEGDAAFAAWADSHGRDWIERITGTHEEDVAAGLTEAAQSGEDADTIAAHLGDWLDAAGRSVLIGVDQVQRGLNAAMMWLARKLGIAQKHWVSKRDARTCPRCLANDNEGWVGFTAPFPDGKLEPPQHPRCRCHLALRVQLKPAAQKSAGRRYVDLPGQEWWPAGSYPSGPAMGGGGPMHTAHDADDIQQYIPGGVPGMTAGGEPPRWDGSEADAVVTSSPRSDAAGRGEVQTRGGGTVEGPYGDFSDETHVHVPDDHDDARWPGERAVGPVAGRSWPMQGYMGGYWPQGGHGTAQAPGGPIAGGTGRGRAPNAYGKTGKGATPGLTARSGMISLDLPDGTITPVPGGLDMHHVTVAYLGSDVDDEAFAYACLRASAAAALLPGPLAGVITGIGSFEPSGSSDGKVPAWAGVMLPGAEVLREALEDLSASEHATWSPHCTLAYVEPGEDLPGPVPPTPVTFTHLSVHRGDDVRHFPLGAALPELAAKGAPKDDDSRLVWLLLRARGEDGKYRFLLQQRTDGTWGMPGGRPHIGEDPWEAAVREAGEEIGELPALRQARSFHHVEDDGETQVFLWLCDVPFFHPQLDGATPEETQGAAWFRRGEIGDLDLAPAFREDWEHGIDLREHVTKGAADLSDPNPVEATHVESQLLANYPPDSVSWVTAKGIHWIGPILVPLDRIDTRDEDGWAASHQAGAVARFAEGIKSGTGHTNPVILVQSPENPKAVVIDGHHRYLAYRKLGRPVKAYVGMTDKVTPAMLETHSSQLHQGASPENE